MYRFLFLLLLGVFGIVHSANAQSVLYQKFTAPTSETMVQSLTDERLVYLQNKFYARTEMQRREALTRAEFLKIVIEASGREGHTLDNLPHPFSDVKGAYTQYIAFAYNNNIINGYPDGTFKPNNPISRAEATKILVQALNIPVAPNQTQFSDIPVSNTLGRYIQTAYNNKLINGTSPTTFNPNATISRGELIKIVYNIQVGTGMERIKLPYAETKNDVKYQNNNGKSSIGFGSVSPTISTVSYGQLTKPSSIKVRSYDNNSVIYGLSFKVLAEGIYNNADIVSMISDFKIAIIEKEGDNPNAYYGSGNPYPGQIIKKNTTQFDFIFDKPIQITKYDRINNYKGVDFFISYSIKDIGIQTDFIELYVDNIKVNETASIREQTVPVLLSKSQFNKTTTNGALNIEIKDTNAKYIDQGKRKLHMIFHPNGDEIFVKSFTISGSNGISGIKSAYIGNIPDSWTEKVIDTANQEIRIIFPGSRGRKFSQETINELSVNLELHSETNKDDFYIKSIETNTNNLKTSKSFPIKFDVPDFSKSEISLPRNGTLSVNKVSLRENIRIPSNASMPQEIGYLYLKAEGDDVAITEIEFISTASNDCKTMPSIKGGFYMWRKEECANGVYRWIFDKPFIIKKGQEKGVDIELTVSSGRIGDGGDKLIYTPGTAIGEHKIFIKKIHTTSNSLENIHVGTLDYYIN